MRKKEKRLILLVIVVIAFLIALAVKGRQAEPTPPPAEYDSSAVVEMIDVGQGDCTLLISGEHSALIDCGPRGSEDKIEQTLEKYQIERLDFIIISHPHNDHYGGFLGLEAEVSALMIDTTSPDDDLDADGYFSVIEKCEEEGIDIISRDEYEYLSLGEFTLSLLAEYPYPEDKNDMSTVVMASVFDKKILFTGDMNKGYEKWLIEENANLDCDILKVSHHASRNSTCDEFLDKTSPTVGLIGVGADNSYGHPHTKTVNRLSNHSVYTYRTDLDGNITLTLPQMNIKTER